ncbi:hypothetical protein CCYA_CCYA04G1355 [Cyanidiococcus yangmingshanensis]|nr:hypothetical protein CCYA_CCYA04G1355 [Cyanidiococcus yangmingshanensis]
MTAGYRHETERAAYDELLRHQVRLLPLHPIDLDSLESITHLIMAAEYVAWLERALEAKFAAALRWIGLLSSTSLYAEAPDAWLDESAPLDLSKEKMAGLWRAEVRTAELARTLGIQFAVFRLGAVYGPIPAGMRGRRGWTRRSVLDTLPDDRKHGEESTASGRPLNKLVNRIHVGDAAHLLLAGLGRGVQGVYNLVDDEPATRSLVEAYAKQCQANERSTRAYTNWDAARLRQVPGPSELIQGGKRICNNSAKMELLGGRSTLWFPSYRDGIQAIAAGDSFPFLPEQKFQDG